MFGSSQKVIRTVARIRHTFLKLKIDFTNLKTLVGVVTDRDPRYLLPARMYRTFKKKMKRNASKRDERHGQSRPTKVLEFVKLIWRP